MTSLPGYGRCTRHSRGPVGSVLLFSLASILSVLHAKAADWSIVSNVSQSVDVDDNFELDADSPGYAVSPTSTATLDITANAPTYALILGGELSYREFTGPGAPSNPEPLSESLDAELTIRRSTYRFGVDGSFARKGATFNETIEEFDELGVTTVNTDRLTYSLGAEASVDINRDNTVSLAGKYRTVDFGDTSGGLVSFEDIDVSASWVQDWSESTEATYKASLGLFDADDAEQTESQTLAVTAGVTKDINERFNVSGSVGVNVIHSSERVAGVEQNDTSVGPVFEVGLGYALGVTEFSLKLSQSVKASALGGLQERRSVEFGVNHQINTRESFGLSAKYTIRDAASSQTSAAGRDRNFVSIAPTYSVSLSRYWSFQMGYQFRVQDSDDGTGLSNRITGTLSRSFVLLP